MTFHNDEEKGSPRARQNSDSVIRDPNAELLRPATAILAVAGLDADAEIMRRLNDHISRDGILSSLTVLSQAKPNSLLTREHLIRLFDLIDRHEDDVIFPLSNSLLQLSKAGILAENFDSLIAHTSANRIMAIGALNASLRMLYDVKLNVVNSGQTLLNQQRYTDLINFTPEQMMSYKDGAVAAFNGQTFSADVYDRLKTIINTPKPRAAVGLAYYLADNPNPAPGASSSNGLFKPKYMESPQAPSTYSNPNIKRRGFMPDGK